MRSKRIHRLKSVTVIGGFLDGLRIELTAALNCIIGARGTGKTTVLELVRYALDAMPAKETGFAKKRLETLIEGNLRGGRVEVELVTAEGLAYTVSRSAGEQPIVVDAKRHATGIAVKSLFRPEIFSQNEVESIADQSRYQLELLDTFDHVEISELSGKITGVCGQITALARSVEALQSARAASEEEVKHLPAIEAKLAAYADGQSADSVAVNEAHRLKAQRDREMRGVRALGVGLGEQLSSIEALQGRASHIVRSQLPDEFLSGPNGDILTRLRESLVTSVEEAERQLQRSAQSIQSFLEGLEDWRSELQTAHEEQELAFRSVVERHKQHQAESAERANLERKRNELIERRRQSEEWAAELDGLARQHEKLLGELSELRDRRYSIRKAVAEKLNRALMPNIRVTVAQDGNPETYQRMIEEMLRGCGVRQGLVAQKLVRLLPPAQLAALVRSGDTRALIDRGELNADQAEKVRLGLEKPTTLAELETVELLDEPTIELRDGEGYKPSSQLSTGQKCTTILPILLLESENPLLIDQPEDNLDNRFIFEAVVTSIQQMKSARQLIFVTHNPNIPVLGEAERVIVMTSDGEHGRKLREGDVDECKESIVSLLEGGEQAFKKRGIRYRFQ